jgi:5-methylcytosine-specific restriction endonuclease McrA
LSLSADAIRLLASKGLSVEDIIQIAEANERERAAAFVDRRTVRERKSEPGPYDGEQWWRLRNSVIARDSGLCAYCDDHDGVTMTADHVVPLSKGGAHDPRNMVCCCVPCNSSKRNMLLNEWPGRSTTRKHRPFDHLLGMRAVDA